MGINIGFILTTLLFLLFFFLGTGRNKRVLLISIIWLILISSLSLTGFFQNTNTIPPRFLIVLIGNITFIAFLYTKLKTVDLEYRYAMLVQALRVPVEITLYFLFLQKQVPEIMTFNGLNFDIIIGISALIFFILSQLFKVNLGKKTLMVWNIIGLLFLMNIVVIAILSAPLPIQQLSFQQPNIAVLSFPYILLPSFIVPIVILTHIISIKQLTKS
ncbi:hypothetical protein [Mongoliitalea lutea]|uniref:Uncharacterized protein n=1 Tax=Mongoliitalea lutea TaxID=849756 RepID=A0A8J3CW62_9BACT|nr:hypothetical protein [Mongoliitalea lutea]GHB27954.1 hypothetical protein GCM10008106_05620 [Mongoliitalea lutea]